MAYPLPKNNPTGHTLARTLKTSSPTAQREHWTQRCRRERQVGFRRAVNECVPSFQRGLFFIRARALAPKRSLDLGIEAFEYSSPSDLELVPHLRSEALPIGKSDQLNFPGVCDCGHSGPRALGLVWTAGGPSHEENLRSVCARLGLRWHSRDRYDDSDPFGRPSQRRNRAICRGRQSRSRQREAIVAWATG